MAQSNSVANPMIPRCKLSKGGNGGLNVDTTEYKRLGGSLLYLTTISPNIMYSVGVISRYMDQPTKMHLQSAKRIL